jgi:small subunit ribosomal protein S8
MSDNFEKMLNKIKNASLIKHEVVLISYTVNNYLTLKVLQQENFIESINIVTKTQLSNSLNNVNKYIKVYLKYNKKNKKPFISNIQLLSKPSLHTYTNHKNIPQVLNGLGIVVMSTSKGIMTNKDAFKNKIGGELLFSIW